MCFDVSIHYQPVLLSTFYLNKFGLAAFLCEISVIAEEGHCVPQHPLTVQDTQHEDFSQPVSSLFLLPISPCLQIKIPQQENLSSALCSEWIGFPCCSNLQGSRCLRPRKATAGGFSLQSICCQFDLRVNKNYFFPG